MQGGNGAWAKAPTTRKPPSAPKPAATAKPAQAGTAIKPKANEAPYGQKKDGIPKKKPGPKTPDTDPHNAKVIEVRKKLEAEGNTVINGGRKPGSKEEVVQIGPGGKRTKRRPDHTYLTPDGNKRGINVGKTKADGSPVKREQEALDDLNKHSDRPTDFVPYDR